MTQVADVLRLLRAAPGTHRRSVIASGTGYVDPVRCLKAADWPPRNGVVERCRWRYREAGTAFPAFSVDTGNWSHGLGPLTGAAWHPALALFRPAVILPHIEIRSIESGELLGRSVHILDARPDRPAPIESVFSTGVGGDRCEIAVDRASGALLLLRCQIDGALLSEQVVDSIEVDVPTRASAFEPFPQRPPRDVSRGAGWGLHDLPARLPFAVLLPEAVELDPGAPPPYVSVDEGDGTAAAPAMFTATYPVPGGTLAISESGSPFLDEEQGRWRLAGKVRVSDGPRARLVRLERRGTQVQMESTAHSVEQLLELARSLRPVPRRRPRLVVAD